MTLILFFYHMIGGSNKLIKARDPVWPGVRRLLFYNIDEQHRMAKPCVRRVHDAYVLNE